LKKNLIWILALILIIPFINADSTFFDNPDDFFIMEDFPSSGGSGSGGGGSGSARISECSQDSECPDGQYCLENKCHSVECLDDSSCNIEEGEVCWDYKCKKLFDIEILEFESPVKTGNFFNFKYFIKAVAEIKGDVEINFWIQKNNSIITSGKDTIYFESYEEKTKIKELFLPKNIASGTYEFNIEITYKTYTAQAHRTIWIDVDEEGIAKIYFVPPLSNLIMLGLIVLVIILLAIITIFYLKNLKNKTKKKSKRRK